MKQLTEENDKNDIKTNKLNSFGFIKNKETKR